MDSIDKPAVKPKKSRVIIIQYNSVVTLTYTFLALFVLLIGIATKGESTAFLFSVYKTSWADPLTYVRLFTHVLGHVDFTHYFGNFLIILLVGPMIEEKYGSVKMLILMVVTAIITGLINIIFFSTGLCGASGIVFMLIILSSYANFERGKIPLTLILVVIAFVGQEIVSGLSAADNISQVTHIVGGAIGAVMGYWISGENKKMAKASANADDEMYESVVKGIVKPIASASETAAEGTPALPAITEDKSK